ncbi:MAG: hypothetical protein JNM43_14745 [Planctomycetaceae bacterium]|nr:hypothetical protein [Planctomycetaceae bacterium]
MSESAGSEDFNPYVAQETILSEPPASQLDSLRKSRSALLVSLQAWLTTGVAGGIFGLFLFGFIGAAFGLVVAFIAAVPVATATFVVLQITCPRGVSTGRAVLASAVCGGITGFGSTMLLFGVPRFGASGILFALIPASIGAFVAAIGVAMMNWNKVSDHPPDPTSVDWANIERQMNDRAEVF